MEKRIASTKQAANKLGMPVRVFLQLREDPSFPKPVLGTLHHLWWDLKAIEQYLDNKTKARAESTDYDSIVRKRLANYGGVQSEICR